MVNDSTVVVFDDERAVANAGVMLPTLLAQRLGIGQLVDDTVCLGDRPGGANAGRKVMTMVSAMALGRTASRTATCCARVAPGRCLTSGRGAVDARHVLAELHVRSRAPARPLTRPTEIKHWIEAKERVQACSGCLQTPLDLERTSDRGRELLVAPGRHADPRTGASHRHPRAPEVRIVTSENWSWRVARFVRDRHRAKEHPVFATRILVLVALLLATAMTAEASAPDLPSVAPIARTEGTSAFVSLTCPASGSACDGTVGFPHRRPSTYALTAGAHRSVAVRLPVRYLRRLESQKRVYTSLELRSASSAARASIRVRLIGGPRPSRSAR